MEVQAHHNPPPPSGGVVTVNRVTGHHENRTRTSLF
jgi:hypothetical protein